MPTLKRARNPYIAGKALSLDRGFFGRRDIFEMVESAVDSNAVVLFGQRRIGKTSILLQLARRLVPPDYLPIYLDLMDRAHRPVGEVLFALASAIAAEMGWPAPQMDLFDDEGVFFQQSILPRLYEAVGAAQRPVLLLDEFDVLDTAEEQRLTSSAAANSFFPYLRRLMEQESRLGFVFVVGRKAEDLSIHVKAVFRTARYKRVSVLDEASAGELIRTAERQGSLSFADEAVERILELTSGHPYFTQLLCGLLWDRAHRGSRQESPRRVDRASVEEAVPSLIETGEHVFQWIWDGLPAAERVIFAAIAQSVDEDGALSSDELLEILERHGIRILTRELEVAPETLVEWEMLARRGEGYGFFVEVLRRWVAERKPLPRVKDELDRIVPLADNLYRTGAAYYRQGDAQRALDQLHQALRVNPNHLKARLLIAEILADQGDLEGALRELEEAHRYDEEAARFPLVRILLVLGEEHEREGRDDAALACYRRLLEISPQERLAKERRAAIWRRWGDENLAAGDLDAAEKAYTKAGDSEKVEEVRRRRQQALFEAELDQARKLASKEQWDRALEIYSRLSASDPENPELTTAKAEATEEVHLSGRYSEILGLMQQKSWEQAISALAELIHLRPDYKDTAELLVRAVNRKRAKIATAEMEAVAAQSPPQSEQIPVAGPDPGVVETEQDSRLLFVKEGLPGKERIRIFRIILTVFNIITGILILFIATFIASLIFNNGVIFGILYLISLGLIAVGFIVGKMKSRKTTFKKALKIGGFSVKIRFPSLSKVILSKSGWLAVLDPPTLEIWHPERSVSKHRSQGIRLFTSSSDGTIFAVDTNRRLHQIDLQGEDPADFEIRDTPLASIETDEKVSYLTVSSNAHIVAAATKRKIWFYVRNSNENGGRFHDLECSLSSEESIRNLGVNCDGSLIGLCLEKTEVTGTNRAILLRRSDGTVVAEKFLGQAHNAYEIAFSPDNAWWTVASFSPSARLWPVPGQTADGPQPTSRKLAQGSVIAFSPDSRHIAVGRYYGGLEIFSVESGERVAKILGNGFSVRSVDFSPDAEKIVVLESTQGIAIFEWKKFLSSGETEPP